MKDLLIVFIVSCGNLTV